MESDLNEKHLSEELYQNLGKLFYAVAKADKEVRQLEIRQLREDIFTYWDTFSRVDDMSDSAEHIQANFESLLQENAESDKCFEEFENYYYKNPTPFNAKVKEIIVRIAHNVAASFSRKNKSELIILAKLQLLFFPSPKQ